jgi:hypothetical protein
MIISMEFQKLPGEVSDNRLLPHPAAVKIAMQCSVVIKIVEFWNFHVNFMLINISDIHKFK